jgi:hypothetical protein
MTSSVHWAHRGISSACTVQAARLPGGPTGVPQAHRVGLAATTKLGGEKSVGGDGAVLVTDGVPSGPCCSVLA